MIKHSDTSFWVVEVQAANGFGALSSEIYTVDINGVISSNEYITFVPFDSEYHDIDLINEAIRDKR